MTTLTLKNGQWVEIKERQTVGDKEAVAGYAHSGVTQDRDTLFNVVKFKTGTIAVHVKNWNVTDEDGKPIFWPGGKSFADRCEVLRKLDGDLGDEIYDLISQHLEAAVTEKNAQTATDSAPTSPSAS